MARDGSYLLALLVIAAVANFLHFTEFGFYEDDWYYCASAFTTPAGQWFAMMRHSMRRFYVGRPLQEACLYVFSYLGAALHSVEALYMIAALLFCTTVVLMYYVLKLRYPSFFAAFASLLFALSPLTTIRQHLDGTLWSAPGFIFLFLAIISYVKRRLTWAYLLAVGALLTYEPMFFVFLAAPFFHRKHGRWKDTARHVVIWGSILFSYLLLRRWAAEPRVVAAAAESPWKIVFRVAEFDVFNTLSSFRSYVYAVYVAWKERPWEGFLWISVLLLPVSWIAVHLRSAANPWRWLGSAHRPAAHRWWIQRAMAPGFGLVALGYAVSYFFFDGILLNPLTGRDTRISLAASFGSSIFTAAVLGLLPTLFRNRWWKTLTAASTIVFLASLGLYSFVIQDDYRTEWEHHRALLTQMIMLSPDVTRGTLFILQRPGIPERLFPSSKRAPSINSQPHGLQVSMVRLFEHNAGPETLVVHSDEWKKYLRLRSDGKLHWTQANFPGGGGRDTARPVGLVIPLQEMENGWLRRSEVPIYIDGQQIVQIREPVEESERPVSNWSRFSASPLVSWVLPEFAFRLAARNFGPEPRAGEKP